MKLLHLHFHLEARGIELWAYDSASNYKHCIYFDPNNKRRVTIPKMDGDDQEVKCELIAEVCLYFEIDIPKEVLAKI